MTFKDGRYTDDYVSRCPYCGGMEMILTYQTAYGAVSSELRQRCKELR